MTARETALRILHQIDTEQAYSNIELRKVLNRSDLSEQDKGFVTELVQGVVKYRKRLDYQIRALSSIRMKKISVWILNILRMGIYQIQFLDRIPNSAAVNESVKLAMRYGHGGSKGFVNAILRRSEMPILPNKEDEVTYLSVFYSYPEWMTERFLKDLGREKTEMLFAAGNEIPPVQIRLNGLREAEDLEGVSASREAPWAYELCGAVGNKDFQSGAYTVQDGASQLVAYAVSPKAGDRVLDVCAAPGGKTTHMAEMMQNDGEIVACDVYDHKLKLIEQAANRLGITIIRPMLQDATRFSEALGSFDCVLVDAPCSGLGIIRRKPDIKWNRTEAEIIELAKIQSEILETASRYVKAGGTLVYSTCTVTKEENSELIHNFLKQHAGFSVSSFGKDFPIEAYREKGELQLFPGMNGTDGFYICRMERTKE